MFGSVGPKTEQIKVEKLWQFDDYIDNLSEQGMKKRLKNIVGQCPDCNEYLMYLCIEESCKKNKIFCPSCYKDSIEKHPNHRFTYILPLMKQKFGDNLRELTEKINLFNTKFQQKIIELEQKVKKLRATNQQFYKIKESIQIYKKKNNFNILKDKFNKISRKDQLQSLLSVFLQGKKISVSLFEKQIQKQIKQKIENQFSQQKEFLQILNQKISKYRPQYVQMNKQSLEIKELSQRYQKYKKIYTDQFNHSYLMVQKIGKNVFSQQSFNLTPLLMSSDNVQSLKCEGEDYNLSQSVLLPKLHYLKFHINSNQNSYNLKKKEKMNIDYLKADYLREIDFELEYNRLTDIFQWISKLKHIEKIKLRINNVNTDKTKQMLIHLLKFLPQTIKHFNLVLRSLTSSYRSTNDATKQSETLLQQKYQQVIKQMLLQRNFQQFRIIGLQTKLKPDNQLVEILLNSSQLYYFDLTLYRNPFNQFHQTIKKISKGLNEERKILLALGALYSSGRYNSNKSVVLQKIVADNYLYTQEKNSQN